MGYSDSADVTEVKGAGTTLTFAKGTNSTNSPKYYTSDKTARMYSGNTLTISSNNQLPIIKIEFVGSTLNALTSDVVTYTSSTGTWTGSAQSVCFTATGKPRFTSIKVTYGEDGGNTPDPTLPKLDTPKVTATVDNTVNNKVTVVWGPITNADSYTVSFSPETIEKATVSASEVGSDGFFTKDYTGLAYNTDYTISVVANPEANADFQPSAAGTATVKTGEDPSPKITGITWNFDGETITSNSPIIEFPIEGYAESGRAHDRIQPVIPIRDRCGRHLFHALGRRQHRGRAQGGNADADPRRQHVRNHDQAGRSQCTKSGNCHL